MQHFTTHFQMVIFATILRGRKGPGLKVKATLVRKRYKNGQKVSDKEMSQLKLENHDTLPNWNYTISPTKM